MDDREKVQAQMAELARKAEELIAQKKPAVIEEVKAKITAYGITALELGFGKKASPLSKNPLAGIPVPIKYKLNEHTWTGRGRQSQFVVDYIANGGKLEDLEIKDKTKVR